MIDSLLGKNAASQAYMRSGFAAAPEQIASNASSQAAGLGLRELASLSSPKSPSVRHITGNEYAAKSKAMELATNSMPMSPLQKSSLSILSPKNKVDTRDILSRNATPQHSRGGSNVIASRALASPVSGGRQELSDNGSQSPRKSVSGPSSRVGQRSKRNHSMMKSFDQRNLPSIKEMVAAGQRDDNTYAMPEYQISKFKGQTSQVPNVKKQSDWNKEKNNNFIDFYTKKKAFVPPPNQYKKVEDGYGFKVQAPLLYRAPRKTEFTEIIDIAKRRTIGPGTFNPKRAQEKVLGTYGGLERITIAESIIATSNAVPSPNKYSLPSFDATKATSPRTIIKEETEKQKEQAVKKWARTDKPNPFSYHSEKADALISTKRRLQSYSFVKGQRTTFSDELRMQEKRHKKPGVGSYSIDKGENRIYKPTVRRR